MFYKARFSEFPRIALIVIFLAACQAAPNTTVYDDTLAKAQAGDAEAQNRVALMYHYGQGVTQDYAAAYEWYQKAALQGINEAQFNLGFLYGAGEGAAQDLRKAYVWYSIAAVERNPLAALRRDEVATKLSAKELSQAKQDIAEIRKQLAPAKPLATP